MQTHIYGIIDSNNCLIDISKSERGTKRYATKNGYNTIGYRNVNSYNATISHEKVGSKWIEYCEHSFIDDDNDGIYGSSSCRYCGVKEEN